MSAAGASARKLRDLAKVGHVAQPEAHLVPTGAGLVHHPSLACIPARATGGKPPFA
jgi:hypothetical protein